MQPEVWETLSDKSGTGSDLANRMFSVLFTKDWLAAHDPWQYCPGVHETTSEESAARQAEAFFSWPGSYDRLPEIRSPTLVVTGTDDVVIPPANAVTLSERIPGATARAVPGRGARAACTSARKRSAVLFWSFSRPVPDNRQRFLIGKHYDLPGWYPCIGVPAGPG